MTRTGISTLVAAALLAAVAAGQTALPGQKQPKPGKDRRSKLEIEIPNASDRERPRAETPADLVRSYLPELEEFPSARTTRAIDQLVLAGPAVAEPLRAVVNGLRFEPKIGAAIALCQLRDDGSFDAVERLLNDPRAKRYVPEVLEGLERLEEERVKEVAFALAGGRDAKLRRSALRFLRSRVDADSVRSLQDLLASRHASVRREAFDLLGGLEGADLTEDAIDLLGDDDSQLADAVTTWLTRHPSEAATAALLELAPRDPPSRRSMWALVTLAELEDATGERLLREEWIDLLDPRLDSMDPLERVSTGIALAQIGFRSERDDIDVLLAARVLPTLMETWLRNEFFKDFLPLFRMSKGRVRRITGIDLGDDLTVWREAWLGGGGVPLIRRDLDPRRLPELTSRLIVRYDRTGMLQRGRDRTIVLASESILEVPPSSFDAAVAIYLTPEEMSILVDRLLETDVLKGRRTAMADGDDEGYRRLSVIHENRERSVVVGDVDDPIFAAFEQVLLDTASEQFWQRLFVGPSEGFAAFYHLRAPAFTPDVDPATRDSALLQMAQVAIPMLERPQRIDALTVLWNRLSARRIPFGVDELRLLLHGLRGERVPEGPVWIVARIIVDQGDPDLYSTFAEFVVEEFGTDATPVLEEVVAGLGVVDVALDDPRAPVRLAACAVARDTGLATPEVLLDRLLDVDPRIVRAALEAMGRSRTPRLHQELYRLARGSDPVLKRVALEALGGDESQEAIELMQQAVDSGDLGFVSAAYRGFALLGGETSIRVLGEAVPRFGVSTQAGLDALDALADIGGAEATSVLVGLLGDQRPEVREEVSYRLALLRDMRAVPTLLEVIETPNRAARAQEALSLLFCCDGGERGEMFVQRWRDEPTLPAEVWFRRTLDLTDDRSMHELSLSILLPAIRDPRWYVRVLAIERLEERFDVSFGSPRRFAGGGDVDRMALRWDGWFAVPQRIRAAKDGG